MTRDVLEHIRNVASWTLKNLAK